MTTQNQLQQKPQDYEDVEAKFFVPILNLMLSSTELDHSTSTDDGKPLLPPAAGLLSRKLNETKHVEHGHQPELAAAESSEANPCSKAESAKQEPSSTDEREENGRERLKRHRCEVAGRVWIPEIWGQEGLLKDWIDCAAFDSSLLNSSIMSARAALVQEGRTSNSSRLRIENSC